MTTRVERLTFGHGLHPPVPPRPLTIAELAHEPEPVRLTHPETWDWGWGGLLIFSVLLFFRPQDQIAAIGMLHVSDLAAAIGLGAMVFLNLSRAKPLTRMTPELAGVIALGMVMLLTVPTSVWPGGSVGVFKDYYSKVMLIFMLTVNTVTSPRRIERICWVIVLAFGYIAARAWLDYARGVNLVEGHRVAGAAGGFFENPNDLAMNLAAFLPLAIMYVKRPEPFWKRALSALIVVLMLGAIVFTKSRSGMVGAVAMFAVFVVTSRSLTPINIMAGIVAGIVLLPMMPQSFYDRMASITDAEKDDTGSRAARKLLMEQAWMIFLEHPLTGVGAGQFQNYGPPGRAEKWRVTHNALLQVAAELGVFGLMSFVFLIVCAFGAAWWTRRALLRKHRRIPKSRRAPPSEPGDGLNDYDRTFLETHSSAMIACMAGWFVCALFASVAFNWTFYYLLGLSVTARDIVRARAKAYAEAKRLAPYQQVEVV
jgi:putative inorganic carbon (HCO3(-)) transporter